MRIRTTRYNTAAVAAAVAAFATDSAFILLPFYQNDREDHRDPSHGTTSRRKDPTRRGAEMSGWLNFGSHLGPTCRVGATNPFPFVGFSLCPGASGIGADREAEL